MKDTIPMIITISRETGQVTEVRRGPAKEADFQRICKELIKAGMAAERREAEA